ncbi:hypothetical protein BP6252_09255 [Coleophoma cylindrospora]|uniref:Uncharacterized protein n=1 Tax=Coleophoma cylindrospora TaxID=1849047 RepID=A0A3D8R1F0_9HELO|nr:hypothetical protein BP6252_09255 [Coleophoma cylindrospora]
MAATNTNASTEELLRRLDQQHQAYLETFRLVHEALLSNSGATNNASGITTIPEGTPTIDVPNLRRLRRSTLDTTDTDPRSERSSSVLLSPEIVKSATFRSSVTGDDSDSSDDDEDLYVQDPLPPRSWDREGLRHHLKTYKFNEEGQKLLESVVVDGTLTNPDIARVFDGGFELGVGSHYSVFDVGPDGAPLSRHEVVEKGTKSIHDAIWQVIRDVNSDSTKERKAVGRITIIREPSPIVFGALHLTMNEYFDMDEIFSHLVHDSDRGASSAHMGSTRAFHDDHRRQRTFIFNFEYFTILGPGCEAMPWQVSDKAKATSSPAHIPISRCSSVVALSLSGAPVRKLKNVSRRKRTTVNGYLYDTWAPWHVLNIQCYPDLKHSMNVHDSSKHYVNGPEAFLYTLLGEFRDCQKRFDEIYEKITKLVTPPANFMFNSKLRDKLLFEDESFTYSRRYFWAYQTLGIMNNNIKSLLDSYDDTFNDQFWAGEHKTLWPLVPENSPRNLYWKKKMGFLKKEFDREIEKLKVIADENNERRKEIRTLRDQLFSGTSVLESRKSVEMTSITIQQGHNIKLLTLSVFGMTNMPTEPRFEHFGITMATVCIPFFLLIGSLNTTMGMRFWVGKWHSLVSWVTRTPVSKDTEDSDDEDDGNEKQTRKLRERSMSQLEALAARKAQMARMSPASTFDVEPRTVLRGRGRSVDLSARAEGAEKDGSPKQMESRGSAIAQPKDIGLVDRLLGRRKPDTARASVV